ncbi:MAG: tetratricopeptide repeat protein [Deltaproteobacteria bacterium]
MNDHRLFLPFVGLMISVCWTGHLLLEKASTLFGSRKLFYRRTAPVIIMILLVYAYGTHQRNNVWHTEESLWKDVTIKSPKNGRGLMNYGLVLMRKGDYAGAEKYFARALPLVPYYPTLYINMGIVKAATDQDDLAESYFIKAVILNPTSPDSYYYYADFLRTRKRYHLAERYARKALLLAPASLDARKLLMSLYLERGQFKNLKILAAQTSRIAPDDKEVKGYLTAAIKGAASADINP